MNRLRVYNSKKNSVDNRLFGSFLEHMGRAIYGGIYEPEHPTADENGFRGDVLELVKELNVSIVRYPGGNFLSGYNWRDGIGQYRPKRLDLAWRTIETNEFGLDEFMKWAEKANVEAMLAVNMGTGTPKDAAEMIEYTNFPKGTELSDARIENGHEEPYGVNVWCVGNEMDGPWQVGQLSAEDYGKKARETAKMMKLVDKTAEIVVVGSSSSEMDTFPMWDRTVLENTYEYADYLSMHRYFENLGDDFNFLTSFLNMNQFIEKIKATADYVKAVKRSNKTMYMSFDEWNVWYLKKVELKDWEIAPPILEDRYSLLDALVFGGMTITLLKNSDRVKVACLAQLVNVIGPIFTEKGGAAIRQTIFYPFKDFSTYGRGSILNSYQEGDKFTSVHGEGFKVESVAVLNESETEITVFALNVNMENSEVLNLEFDYNVELIEHKILDGDDLNAINTFENPDAVKPRFACKTDNPKAIVLPKCSHNVIRFKVIGG